MFTKPNNVVNFNKQFTNSKMDKRKKGKGKSKNKYKYRKTEAN